MQSKWKSELDQRTSFGITIRTVTYSGPAAYASEQIMQRKSVNLCCNFFANSISDTYPANAKYSRCIKTHLNLYNSSTFFGKEVFLSLNGVKMPENFEIRTTARNGEHIIYMLKFLVIATSCTVRVPVGLLSLLFVNWEQDNWNWALKQFLPLYYVPHFT